MFNKLKKSNKHLIKKSALFIFLNKTCFRGVYRENTNGDFNVPFGNYNNVEFYNKDNLLNCSLLFNKYGVKFFNISFFDWLKIIDFNKQTFIYLDPPYYPENDESFTSYIGTDFIQKDHSDLLFMCHFINYKQSKFLLSNSNTSFIKDNLNQFNIDTISLKRQINSKNPGSTANEVLIYN